MVSLTSSAPARTALSSTAPLPASRELALLLILPVGLLTKTGNCLACLYFQWRRADATIVIVEARAAAIALCAANGVTITLPGGMSATTTSAASSPSTTTAAPPSGPTIATPATGPTTTTAATAVPTSAATSAVPVPTGGSPCRPQYQPRRNINL